MKKFGYYWAKILCRLKHSHEPMNEFYRRGGVKIGSDCLICSSPLTKEAFLVNIGNHTTISTNVSFVTHDNSVKLLYSDKSDCFGRIVIGDDCFIGQNATIMYGVKIEDRTIVAAGAVVTKSFKESGIIIGGNPARIIGTWDKFKEKIQGKAIKRSELVKLLKEDDSFLVSK